jgi:hypothetical protein
MESIFFFFEKKKAKIKNVKVNNALREGQQ